jgi:hypothetical protein
LGTPPEFVRLVATKKIPSFVTVLIAVLKRLEEEGSAKP